MIQVVRTEIPDQVMQRTIQIVNMVNKLIGIDPTLWRDYAEIFEVRRSVNTLISLRTGIPADDFAFAFPPCGTALLRVHYTDDDGCHELFTFVVSSIPVE